MDATSELEDKHRALAESRIREAIEAGEFDNLRGSGQPADIEENPHVPEEWRMGFHLLKQNNITPAWIELANEIEADLQAWRAAADRHFAEVRERLARVASDPYSMKRLRAEVEALKSMHTRAAARHQHGLDEINRKIHYFNATVPVQSRQLPTLDREGEMRRFADRLPAYLNY
jgi:hypothetical protein